jgi:hypothetical protein
VKLPFKAKGEMITYYGLNVILKTIFKMGPKISEQPLIIEIGI